MQIIKIESYKPMIKFKMTAKASVEAVVDASKFIFFQNK